MKFEISPMEKLPPDWNRLVKAAAAVRLRAYAPYSGYKVASAIEDENKNIHVGVNVENASYGGTTCAERSATARMIAEGGHKIVRVVVITPTEDPNFPCGACLQTLQEFQSDTVVVSANVSLTRFSKARLSELFPAAFSAEKLTRSDVP